MPLDLTDDEIAAIRRQLVKRWRSRDEQQLTPADLQDTLVGLMATGATHEGEAAAETLQALRDASAKQLRLDDLLSP